MIFKQSPDPQRPCRVPFASGSLIASFLEKEVSITKTSAEPLNIEISASRSHAIKLVDYPKTLSEALLLLA